ncbi:huntingtin-interacting protein K-like protein [Cricetulus griseus]|nr:huntingtin-interacting protein K-like protein [Cricetulus griseus]
MRRRGEIEMATEGDVELELETETSGPERPPEKPRKHDSGAADLERVTDYAEEKEIQSSNLETAMSVIGDRRSREQKAKQEREKELAKVTIKKEDLELIVSSNAWMDAQEKFYLIWVPNKWNDRDGDLSSSSRKELAGTHGQRCGGSYCPNQLMMCFFRHSGLIY